ELWSSTYDSILSPLLFNPEKQVILRWYVARIVNDAVQVKPDALLCEIDQLCRGRSLGLGEVKLIGPTVNIDALGQDLLRLADLTQQLNFMANFFLKIL
ncbi:hypothetical protein BX666DRAFT_1857327, partial [Dichotomocladium elegans]